MSPRSEDFQREAEERLAAARLNVEHGAGATALSAAYYATLYAARAALSEEDRYARTHRGIWHLFYQTFVATGRFEPELHAAASGLQRPRIQADYEAAPPTLAQAAEAVRVAERFVGAVRSTFG